MESSASPKLSGEMGLPLAVDAALLVGLIVYTAFMYGSLPEKIPLHFNFAGTPDGWGDKAYGAWFVPGASLFVHLIFLGAWWMVRNKPAWVNMPRKQEFLALPPEARTPITAMLVRFVVWMGAVVGVLLLYVQAGIIQVAIRTWSTLPAWPMLALIGGFLALVTVFYIRIARAVRRATLAGGGSPPA